MRAGRVKIELVAIYCPHCNEAHYDKDGHDWREASFEGADDSDRWRVAMCNNCLKVFRMPVLVGRIGL